MQILFTPVDKITTEHLDMLMESWKDAPSFHKMTRVEVLSSLVEDQHKLFEVRADDDLKGVFMVSVMESNGERRLMIDAFNFIGAMKHRHWWVKEMKRLASHWKCQRVETTVFTERLAKMHKLLGSEVETITLAMEVEDEQQEENNV